MKLTNYPIHTYIFDTADILALEVSSVDLLHSRPQIIDSLVFDEAKTMSVEANQGVWSPSIRTLCRHVHERLQSRQRPAHPNVRSL